MPFGGPLSVTTPTDNQIVIARHFDAPHHLVFACYTQPPLIRRWLTGPDGWTMPVCEFEARAGGKYRYEWLGPAASVLAVSGQIGKIEIPDLIDAQEQFDGDVMGPPYRSELLFTPEAQTTLVTNRFTYTSQAHRDMAVGTGMADGMEMSFSNLDRVLAEELGR